MLIPTVVDIETVRGICNARCIMCSIESPKVQPGIVIPNQVFEKILRRYAPYAVHLIQVNLVGIGEPLVDLQVREKVKITKCVLTSARLAIITNASLLTPVLSKNVLDSWCDDMIVSIDSIYKVAYEGIRIRLNLEKSLDCINGFTKERDSGITTQGMIQLCYLDIGANFCSLGSILDQDLASIFSGDIFSMIRDAMNENCWQELPCFNRCNIPLQREKRLSAALQ